MISGEPGTKNENELLAEIEHLKDELKKLRQQYEKKDEEGVNKSFFRQIVELSEDGMAVVDQLGVVTYVNQRMANMLKVEKQKVPGKSIFDLLNFQSWIIVSGSEDNSGLVNNIYDEEKLMSFLYKNRTAGRLDLSLRSLFNKQFAGILSFNTISFADDPYYLVVIKDISEKMVIEKRLRQNEQEYEQLVESANSIIIRWNEQGEIKFANHYALGFFGYPRDEFIGKHVSALVPEKDSFGKDLTILPKEVLENPERFTLNENENITKSGERVWVSWTNRAITDEDGNLRGILAIGNDITERKKAEQEVRTKAIEIEAILSSVPVGVVVYDTNGNILRINDYAAKLFNYTNVDKAAPITLKQKTEFNLFSEEGILLAEEDFPGYRSAKMGETITNRVVLLERQGTSLWLLLNSAPLFIGSRHVGGMLSIQDITASKFTEKLLRENEERFRALADNISQMTWIADKNGLGIWYNKRWVVYTGINLEGMARDGKRKIIHPEHYEQVVGNFYDAVNALKPWEDIVLLRSREGNYRWFLSRAVPIFNDKGEVTFYFGTHTDITEQRESEQALQKQNEELAIAKEKAEESDRLKSAFLANMSHEIRTPMTGILGFADLMKQPGITDEQFSTYLRMIESSGKRMLQIINDLIDISKIEAGLVEVKSENTDLKSLLEDLSVFFAPEADKKNLNLKLSIKLKPDELITPTDKTKLDQILSNLLKNAIKFTHKGFIEFGCEKVEGFYLFFVKDTGIGIPKDLTAVVFERFRQGEISWNEKSDGVGLGLAISKAYVEMLGGHIYIESEYGVGSGFFFTIPCKEQIPELSEPLAADEATNEKIEDIKVLIAEDEEALYYLLREILRSDDILSVYAGDGKEAVEMVRDNPEIDLVLMDSKMPKLNGLDATKIIRSFNRDIPIIALSAYSSEMDKQKALDAGCNDYVVKPMNKAQLIEKIRFHIIRSKTRK